MTDLDPNLNPPVTPPQTEEGEGMTSSSSGSTGQPSDDGTTVNYPSLGAALDGYLRHIETAVAHLHQAAAQSVTRINALEQELRAAYQDGSPGVEMATPEEGSQVESEHPDPTTRGAGGGEG